MATTTRRAQPLLPGTRWYIAVPMLVLFVIGVVTLVPKLATLSDVADVFHRLAWLPLGGAVVAQIASYWGNGFTIRAVARLANDTVPLLRATMIAIASGTVGLLAGGPVGQATSTHHWMRRAGNSSEAAILCGWLPAILNAGVLILIACAGGVSLAGRKLVSHSQSMAIGVLAVPIGVLVVAAVWALAKREHVETLVGGSRRLWARLRRRKPDTKAINTSVHRIVAARTLLVHRGGWRAPVIGAFANEGFDVLTMYLLFVAAGKAPAPEVLLAGYGLPLLIARFAVFLPGGVGLVEGGMVGLYSALGIPRAVVVLVVLAYRGLSFWLPSLIGIPMAVYLQRSSGDGSA